MRRLPNAYQQGKRQCPALPATSRVKFVDLMEVRQTWRRCAGDRPLRAVALGEGKRRLFGQSMAIATRVFSSYATTEAQLDFLRFRSAHGKDEVRALARDMGLIVARSMTAGHLLCAPGQICRRDPPHAPEALRGARSSTRRSGARAAMTACQLHHWAARGLG